MKFIVSSSALYAALQSVSKVIASKNTLPVLDSFLFDLADEKLTIIASDVETRLTTSLDVINAEGSGRFAIDAKRLLDPLKELSEQPVTIDVNDDSMVVNVEYANGKFNIPGQSGDTYPQHKPLKENAVSVMIESQVLLNGINRSMFAVAEDELRPVMNGVYFDFYPDNLTIVASDGHKLARLRLFSVQSNERASFILPRKPAGLLKGLLLRNSDVVTMSFDENNAYVKTASFEMICRLIEGRYPNYNAVIPMDNPNLATIDRLSFLAALKRVSVFANQASGLVKVQLTENEVVIYAQDIDFSISGEEKVVCQYTSEYMDIGFKAACLIDILANIVSDNVIIKLADSTRACVVVPEENKENEDLLMLLVPLMLNEY